jgi:hypothetical protein
MTTPDGPSDDELRTRIRRATSHYRLERPMPVEPVPARGTVWPRVGALAVAAAAGAVLAIAGVSLVSRTTPGPGSSPSPATSAVPTASTVPTAPPVSAALADARCRKLDGELPAAWLGNGATPESIGHEFATLPRLHDDQRDHAALFVYADTRFLVTCVLGRGTDEVSIIRSVREAPGSTGLAYAGGASGPGGMDPRGRLVVDDVLMWGSAAAGVDRVEVVLEDGGLVEAWVGNGAWVAWWNEPISAVAVRAHHDDGSTTGLEQGMNAHRTGSQPTGSPVPSPS